MTTRTIAEYFVAEVPPEVDLDDVGRYAELLATLRNVADATVLAQYAGRRIPLAVVLDEIEWLVTDSADEVERFQPDHDCDECRAGNVRAREFLTANQGRSVACANLRYTEVWP